mmetsp:Transcript_9292/g.21009  ORF Transcript_9292/g.21009 Transcript_9292/m.21009 type:complete len:153 (-) Transcript_9292:476-934(-)
MLGVCSRRLLKSHGFLSFTNSVVARLHSSSTLKRPTTSPTFFPNPSRLVAFGDVHGDSEAFEELLFLSGLVAQPGGPWTGDRAVLVQVGDVLDRGLGEIGITLRLDALAAQALKAGGRIIRLLGNHEACPLCPRCRVLLTWSHSPTAQMADL